MLGVVVCSPLQCCPSCILRLYGKTLGSEINIQYILWPRTWYILYGRRSGSQSWTEVMYATFDPHYLDKNIILNLMVWGTSVVVRLWYPDDKYVISFWKMIQNTKRFCMFKFKYPCEVRSIIFHTINAAVHLKILSTASWWLRFSISTCLTDSWTELQKLHSSSSCIKDK